MKHSFHPFRGLLVLPCISLAAASAFGQTSAPPPPIGADATIKLSPFEVKTDQDTGYIAADTLSAGRLSTNLLKTPGDIDVFTRDLINDLGAMNIDTVSGWLTNARPIELGAIEGNSMNPASVGGADSGTNVSFRGLGAQPSTRNYFLSATTPKEYNVERIEASRGPNAILYGEGGPGGQTNYITKVAKDHDFTVVRERVDSMRSQDVSVDVNRAISDKLDVRYNFDTQNKGYYISNDQTKTTGNALDVIFKPFERTTLNVAVDYSVVIRPIINISENDNYSLWNKVPVGATPLTSAQATAAGLSLWTTSHLTYIEGMGVIDLKGTAYTTGAALPAVTEYAYGFKNVVQPPDKSFNPNPAANMLEDHNADFQTTLDHTWASGLSAQLAGQYSKYRTKGGNYASVGDYIDPNQFLPSGAVNPEFGKMYSYSYLGHVTDGTERDNSTLRAVADYPVTIDWLGTTNFSVFLTHQQANARTVFSDYHISNPASTVAITDASSEIFFNRYWDNLPGTLPNFSSMYNLVKVPTSDVQTKQRTDAFEAAGSGDYFHDTLSIVGGFRRDRSNFDSETGITASRDAKTGQFTAYTPDSRTGLNNTVTAGAVYFPEKYVGLYVNHAEGFTVSSVTAPQIDGTFAHANIVPASDESVGLRFDFAPSSFITVEGAVGWYYTKQKDSTFTIGVAAINQLWLDHNLPQNYILTFDPSPTTTAADNAITSYRSTVGWGWEGNLVANVGNSFRFFLNGAIPNTKQSNVGSDYVAYVNKNLATWQGYANDPTNPTRTLDTTEVNSILQVITGFQDGRRQNLTYEYRLNAFGVYTLHSTALKGLRFGGGLQYYGPAVIGNAINLPFDYTDYRAYGTAMVTAGYPIKIHRGVLDVQVNVSNVGNYDRQIYSGLIAYQGVNVPYGFHYSVPRTAQIQMTYSF